MVHLDLAIFAHSSLKNCSNPLVSLFLKSHFTVQRLHVPKTSAELCVYIVYIIHIIIIPLLTLNINCLSVFSTGGYLWFWDRIIRDLF